MPSSGLHWHLHVHDTRQLPQATHAHTNKNVLRRYGLCIFNRGNVFIQKYDCLVIAAAAWLCTVLSIHLCLMWAEAQSQLSCSAMDPRQIILCASNVDLPTGKRIQFRLNLKHIGSRIKTVSRALHAPCVSFRPQACQLSVPVWALSASSALLSYRQVLFLPIPASLTVYRLCLSTLNVLVLTLHNACLIISHGSLSGVRKIGLRITRVP